MFDEGLAEIVQRDPRYAYEAYEFVFHALHYTQKKLGRLPQEEAAEAMEIASAKAEHHVSGRELVEGARDLALREFGYMARVVFKLWGINKTDDFGNIVFNLIEGGLMSKTDHDCQEDFNDVYDLDEALVQGYRIELTRDDPEGNR